MTRDVKKRQGFIRVGASGSGGNWKNPENPLNFESTRCEKTRGFIRVLSRFRIFDWIFCLILL